MMKQEYIAPDMGILIFYNEGVLCGSSSHDSFVVDDEWGDLLEEIE